MARLSEARKRHLILRALVTASITLKRGERVRQPASDIVDMDALIDDFCTEDELQIYVDGAFWSLGLDPVRPRGRRGPSS